MSHTQTLKCNDDLDLEGHCAVLKLPLPFYCQTGSLEDSVQYANAHEPHIQAMRGYVWRSRHSVYFAVNGHEREGGWVVDEGRTLGTTNNKSLLINHSVLQRSWSSNGMVALSANLRPILGEDRCMGNYVAWPSV